MSANAKSAERPSTRNTKYDHAALRNGVRRGRERGCWVYIPAEELEKAGIDPFGQSPRYQLWPGRKRTILVQLHKREGEA